MDKIVQGKNFLCQLNFGWQRLFHSYIKKNTSLEKKTLVKIKIIVYYTFTGYLYIQVTREEHGKWVSFKKMRKSC